MSQIELTCEICGTTFSRAKKEYNRSLKLDRRMFCSRSCTGKGVKNNLGDQLGIGRPSNLNSGNRQDEYSPFRYFVKKARERKHKYDIDVEYLKVLWEIQDGRCALSGLKMVLPKNASVWEKDKGNPWKPSLDRTDPSVGYMKGNVRFVCNIGNLCKNIWPDDTVYHFCKEVAKNMAKPVRCGGLDYKEAEDGQERSS